MPNKFVSAGGGAFSNGRNDWETPKDKFKELDKEFCFDLDAAASNENYKVKKYYTIKDNSLEQDWEGNVFCNPPYGQELRKWVEKAYIEKLRKPDRTIVLLIPARTDTSYWHDFIFNKASEIRFLRGRLKFELNGISKGAAPFPSAVIIY